MGLAEQRRDRRGRAERGAVGLLEREALLEVIRGTIEQVRDGSGQALLIEGHAGIGKTRLYEAALDHGRRLGFRVLRAAGAELERHVAFGIASQLLAGHLDELPPERRSAVIAGLPARVRALIQPEGEDMGESEGSDLGLMHGVFTIIATADESQPMLLAIDDLHWCDSASLELVLYILHRLDELAMAVVMSGRVGMGQEVADVLDRIASHPRVQVEVVSPLGRDAVGKLAWRELGKSADEDVVAACLQVTGGNPFFLRELLRALRNEGGATSGELARRAATLAPDAVIRTLRVRVGRLGQAARALARAVVVLGDDVPLRHAAALAGLDVDSGAAAADALAQVEILLAREPLRFVHPLVRQALERDTPAAELATRHFQAAQLLHSEGATPERVAAHLLLSHRRGDPWVIERLSAAAREARARAVPRSAVRYLRRALEEPPSDALRVEVLAQLGAAEAAAGLPEAAEHFAEGIAATKDPMLRARLALERGRCLDSQGYHERAARSYDAGLAELPAEPEGAEQLELRDQLEADFVATATVVPSLQAQALTRSAGLLGRAVGGPQTQGQRLRLAQAALYSAFRGDPADKLLDLAGQAWDGGRLLECGTPQGIGWRLVSSVSLLAGDLERAAEVAEAALEESRRRGWPFSLATAAYMRALPLLWQARVDDALSELEIAGEARGLGWRQFARAAAAHHALALLEKGEADRAENVLFEDVPVGAAQQAGEVRAGEWGELQRGLPVSSNNLEDAMRLYSLAGVRLAQGRAREALDAALGSGAVVESTVEFYGYCPWRTTAAEAALALGDRSLAEKLAREAVERAEQIGVLHQRIRTQCVLGLCQGPREGLSSLKAAVKTAEGAPPRLETVRALVELGGALRRSNQRVAAREPLQRAADMAWAGGATVLHERARTELAATGARPRRVMLLSGPDSLTPSERRIAELAAVGHSNREIAQTLFVTPKTVEYHLRNTYRKLDIDGRESLSEVLVA
jgi:DNA-binding CsgD family transcriptional regulator